jgi:hypothetical protein
VVQKDLLFELPGSVRICEICGKKQSHIEHHALQPVPVVSPAQGTAPESDENNAASQALKLLKHGSWASFFIIEKWGFYPIEKSQSRA